VSNKHQAVQNEINKLCNQLRLFREWQITAAKQYLTPNDDECFTKMQPELPNQSSTDMARTARRKSILIDKQLKADFST
jgi:hypothetical protein